MNEQEVEDSQSHVRKLEAAIAQAIHEFEAATKIPLHYCWGVLEVNKESSLMATGGNQVEPEKLAELFYTFATIMMNGEEFILHEPVDAGKHN